MTRPGSPHGGVDPVYIRTEQQNSVRGTWVYGLRRTKHAFIHSDIHSDILAFRPAVGQGCLISGILKPRADVWGTGIPGSSTPSVLYMCLCTTSARCLGLAVESPLYLHMYVNTYVLSARPPPWNFHICFLFPLQRLGGRVVVVVMSCF